MWPMIDWNIVSSIATAFGAVVTGVGVMFGAWQIRLTQKQSQAEFEDSFDQQYRVLTMELPVDILIGKEIKDEQKSHIRELIYNYFDLANEQAYLRAKGRITRHTWNSWCAGMSNNIAKPAFTDIYNEIIDSSSFTYLKRLVDSEFKSDPKTWY
jgi:hypothetical protein